MIGHVNNKESSTDLSSINGNVSLQYQVLNQTLSVQTLEGKCRLA